MPGRVGCPICCSGCEFCNGEGYVDEDVSEQYFKDQASSEDEVWRTCDDCGKFAPDVFEGVCPYQYEIYNEEIPVTLCDYCHGQRSYEI